jgi:hypothetical protein
MGCKGTKRVAAGRHARDPGALIPCDGCEDCAPNLTKMKKARDEKHTQDIGLFLDWLLSQEICLSSRHHHNDSCYNEDDEDHDERLCGLCEGELFLHIESTEHLLARYCDVDLEACEKEKLALLEEIRARDAGAGR